MPELWTGPMPWTPSDALLPPEAMALVRHPQLPSGPAEPEDDDANEAAAAVVLAEARGDDADPSELGDVDDDDLDPDDDGPIGDDT